LKAANDAGFNILVKLDIAADLLTRYAARRR
jgi:hypothetical protein